MSAHLASVLAHGGANDWWLEMGLPLVVLLILYFWSQRGERKRSAAETAALAKLRDDELRARIAALVEHAGTPTEQKLIARLRAEVARREHDAKGGEIG